MPATVLYQPARPCPRCGGEKMLRHSRVCGYCYETASRGSDLGGLLDYSSLNGEQRVDFHLGAGLAVSLGTVALGAGAAAAGGVLMAEGLNPASLAGAALAFGGAAGVSFGSLTGLCLLYLRTRRPYSVLGLVDALWGSPRRRLEAWWREVNPFRESDPWAWKEDEWS